MQPSFWHEKWNTQQIGFHLSAVNPLLIQFWPQLALDTGAQVFVPLCGKSLDMCFLAEQGHEVVGCELNALAVKQFFQEQNLPVSITAQDQHTQFSAEQVTIYQGDFFTLDAAKLTGTCAFYDRAALIAWPEDLRLAYAKQLAKLIPAGSVGLLITLDYPQAELNGPPFSVPKAWVNTHLAADFDIECLASADVLNDNPRFVKKQVTSLTESVYKLRRKG